jgi:tetratricopeptide (TPR) repeat protein
MAIAEISNIYLWINKNLSERKFAMAFFLIQRLVAELHDYNTSVRYEELVEFYRNILNYRLSDTEKDENDSVFQRFLTDLYTLADTAKERLLIKYSSRLEYERIRLFEADSRYFIPKDVQYFGNIYDILLSHYLSISVNDLINNKLTDEDEKKLFNKHQKFLGFTFHNVWLWHNDNENLFEPIFNILKDESIGLDAKCITISALTLNILRNFDTKKIEILFSSVEHENQEIRQRALIGIMFLLAKYGHYFKSDEKLKNRFLVLVDENACLDEMESIVFQLIRTTETEKISKRIEQEIFPELMRMSPILRDKFRNIEHNEDEERNPEWKNFFEENGGSTEKLEEFSEMQMSGSDVYLNTFARMKHFYFFEPIENWFVPFNKEHPAVTKLYKQNPSLFSLILHHPALCNSDKYAFLLSLLNMGEKERSGVETAMRQEKMQLEEMVNEMKTLHKNTEEKIIANHYIQDIYRFYSQHPRHGDFDNPLNEITSLINKSIFYTLFSDKEKLKNIGGYYFAYNHYNQALKLYLHIFEHQNPNFDIARKIGYCYQKKLQFQNALHFYMIVENIDKNDTWILKRMAYCYRKAGNYIAAADCYKRILEIKPDDLKLLFGEAMCYIESENFEDALSLLHKINYLNPKYPKIRSVLLWCNFCCGKMEQAKDLSLKVLEETPDIQDFITIANVYLVLNDKINALQFYEKALSSATNYDSFLELFKHDIERLIKFGVKNSDIDLLFEMALLNKLPAAN